MKENINTETSFASFPEHYGKFPYLLVRISSAVYMQIPIRFNVDIYKENFKGVEINDISLKLIEKYKEDKTSKLHDIIIDRTRIFKIEFEEEWKAPVRLCLVEDPETANYFEGREINPSHSIPNGGTLLNQSSKIIAMNSDHYLKE
ncbi:hypothetical protein [Algoriphagus limi]|uniref:Uncharacterized protein n=1 Tax=Algoriphagus limi TaxID=2975273 RepID=A0ABT2G0W3_9BACT|nr:hypothetical protein [Algoriphagus limi]MCS5488910.1 hypothetical protein [Algoriphagus limi]